MIMRAKYTSQYLTDVDKSMQVFPNNHFAYAENVSILAYLLEPNANNVVLCTLYYLSTSSEIVHQQTRRNQTHNHYCAEYPLRLCTRQRYIHTVKAR